MRADNQASLGDDVIMHLTKPRLKPDCPVLVDTHYSKDVLIDASVIGDDDTNIRPFVLADRVMEWAREYATKYGWPVPSEGCDTFMQKRICEETEVQE